MRFDEEFFTFVGFCALLRLPFFHHLARVVGKNRSEKNMQKVFKNGSAGNARKTVPGAVGPLKTDNQIVLSRRHWAEHGLRA